MQKIIFDLWGTLAYLTEGEDFGIAIADKLGITKGKYHEFVKNYWFKKNINSEEFAKILVEKTGNANASIKFLTRQILSPHGREKLYPESKRVLKKLKETGNLYLISDTSSLGKKMFYNLGISDFFKGLYFSCDQGLTKEKGLYSFFFESLGIKPNKFLVIGDSKRLDYQIPLELGARVILVDRNGSHPKIKGIKNLEGLR